MKSHFLLLLLVAVTPAFQSHQSLCHAFAPNHIPINRSAPSQQPPTPTIRLPTSLDTVSISATPFLSDIRIMTASPLRVADRFRQVIFKAMRSADGDIWKGTGFHLMNGIAAGAIAIAMSSHAIVSYSSATTSPLSLPSFPISHLAMAFGFITLICDNAILAAGKFVGPGPTLRFLTKLRLVGHGAAAPLFCIPIIRAVSRHGLLARNAHGAILTTVTVIGAMLEGFHWMQFDANELQEIDNRNPNDLDSSRYLPGVFAYTSGKTLKCILPIMMQNVVATIVGGLLWKRFSSVAGALICLSGVTAFATCSSPKLAHVQCAGESVCMGLLWASVLAIN